MSSYRCPVCGANHKDAVPRCRLCGQSLAPGAVASTRAPATTGPARAQRGIKGVMLIGLGLIVALVVVAVVFGVLEDDRQVQRAQDLLTRTAADGWSTEVEAEGRFEVELPAGRTRSTAAFAGAPRGALTAWQAAIGDDTEVLVGWTTVAPPGQGSGPVNEAIAVEHLKAQVVDQWAAANGLERDATATVRETNLAGLPAVEVHSLYDRFTVKGRNAYAHAVLALRGNTLYVIQVLTIYKEQPQLARMAASFVPTP